ncbi:hypothetical protein [Ferrimonas aestuarii]|uniref:ResB-like domain-containing protein n=1 Tax=Ferrimonas aestuarii TaxID=2569539 RepID=A0A4U1BT96_9GAMM|nr:hypothetical protein [Ferrimonas aestuarii]TKB58686.1 hypothetical protein FCL42_02765 [Ferrimonas aestuarii]
MMRLFSSMRLGCALLVLAALWFALGMGLADLWGYRWPLKQLNQMPLIQWGPLMQDNPVLLLWLLSLVSLFALLGINTLVCSYKTLWPLWRRKKLRHRHFMLLPIHLFTLLVFACHGLDILWAHHPQHVQLKVGESARFEGHQIELTQIEYGNDLALIRQDQSGHTAAGRITRRSLEQFDPNLNWAFLRIIQEGSIRPIHGQAGFLTPLTFGNRSITLTDFYVPFGQEDDALTVSLTLTNNPLSGWFLGCYLALLISLILHLAHLVLFSSPSEKARC